MSISRRPVILGGKWNETMEEQTMKYGVIDVGGGLRGIYGAGVLDRCMELEAMYRKGWQDAEKLVQWYRAAKAEA